MAQVSNVTRICLNVGVSAKGANLIMSRFGNLGMAWGTDARAFSEIALEYFKDSAAGGSIVDKDLNVN